MRSIRVATVGCFLSRPMSAGSTSGKPSRVLIRKLLPQGARLVLLLPAAAFDSSLLLFLELLLLPVADIEAERPFKLGLSPIITASLLLSLPSLPSVLVLVDA